MPARSNVNQQLAELLGGADGIDDSATRSALLWMDAAMADPATGDLQVRGRVPQLAPGTPPPAASCGACALVWLHAAPSPASRPAPACRAPHACCGAGTQPRPAMPCPPEILTARHPYRSLLPTRDSSSPCSTRPPPTQPPKITDDTMQQLGTFLRAAENLEALKWWAETFAVNHPQLQLELLVQVRPCKGSMLWPQAPCAQAHAYVGVVAWQEAAAQRLGPRLLRPRLAHPAATQSLRASTL